MKIKIIFILVIVLTSDPSLYSQRIMENKLIVSFKNNQKYSLKELSFKNEKFKQAKNIFDIRKIDRAYPYAPENSYRASKHIIEFEKDDINKLIESLKGISEINNIETIKLIKVEACIKCSPTPDDIANSQNLMDFLKGECAWYFTKGHRDVKIAIVDEIPDYEHIELDDKVDLYDNLTGTGTGYHGIPVAGDAAAHTDNNFGISSIGYKCGLFLYNVASSSSGYLVHSAIINAIDKAVIDGADIINCSFSSGFYSRDLNNAIQNAISNGIVVVAAAGAIRDHVEIRYPCGYNNVICVTDVDLNNNHSANQNYHSRVDICAPSKGFYAIRKPDSLYIAPGGTSHSSPIVAGTCGLLKSINQNFSPSTIREIIKKTGRPVNNENSYPGGLGGGTLNAYCALFQASQPLSISGLLAGTYQRYFINVNNAETNGNVNISAAVVNINGPFEVKDGNTFIISNPSSFPCSE